jgi:hypothetical protein
MKILLLPTLLLFSSVASGGDFSKSPIPPSKGGWSTSFSIGPNWRKLGGVTFRGGSQSQNVLVPSFIGGNELILPPIGTENSIADRTYDDGFVRLDGGTLNNGLTWNWGYDSVSQVGNDQLTYRATGFRSDYSESSALTPAQPQDSDFSGAGIVADVILRPPAESNFPFSGLLLSLSYFGDDQDSQFSTFSGSQLRQDFRLDFIDVYDTTGIIVPIRDGYAGTFNGPGPKIGNLPDSRTVTDVPILSENATYSNSISSSLDLDSMSFAFGPVFEEEFTKDWFWQISFGATLNVFDWSASQNETLSSSVNGGAPSQIASFANKSSDTDVKLGVFGRVAVTRLFEDGWFASMHLQGDYVGAINLRVGPSTYQIDPSSISIGLVTGRRF